MLLLKAAVNKGPVIVCHAEIDSKRNQQSAFVCKNLVICKCWELIQLL